MKKLLKCWVAEGPTLKRLTDTVNVAIKSELARNYLSDYGHPHMREGGERGGRKGVLG